MVRIHSESTFVYKHAYVCTYYELLYVHIGLLQIAEPSRSVKIFGNTMTLSCGQNVTIRSIVTFRTIGIYCEEDTYDGSQALTWKIYKDGVLTQYNSTPIFLRDLTDSDYGTYTFVLSTSSCGSAVRIARLLRTGELIERAFLCMYKCRYLCEW